MKECAYCGKYEVLGGDDCGKLYGVKFKIKTLMDIIEGEE